MSLNKECSVQTGKGKSLTPPLRKIWCSVWAPSMPSFRVRVSANQYTVVPGDHLDPLMNLFYPVGNGLFQDSSRGHERSPNGLVIMKMMSRLSQSPELNTHGSFPSLSKWHIRSILWRKGVSSLQQRKRDLQNQCQGRLKRFWWNRVRLVFPWILYICTPPPVTMKLQ